MHPLVAASIRQRAAAAEPASNRRAHRTGQRGNPSTPPSDDASPRSGPADVNQRGRVTAEVAIQTLAVAVDQLRHDDPRDWPTWIALVPHAHALLDNATQPLTTSGLDDLAFTMEKVARALLWQGAEQGCADLVEHTLDRTARLGPDRRSVLQLRFLRANVMLLAGSAAGAESQLREVLDLQEQLLSPQHPDALTTRHFIARAVAVAGRHAEAEELFREVLADRRGQLGENHPDTLITRQFVAREMAAQGRAVEAEREFREVLAARETTLGGDHLNTLATRHLLAKTIAEQGRTAEAARVLRELLAARLRLLGPDHIDTRATEDLLHRLPDPDPGSDG